MKWLRVICAADCLPCLDCGEPVCPVCSEHYAECDCPGPHQLGEYHYQFDSGGQLWAQPKRSMQ